MTLPHEGESVRENPTEPASENITISEEVLQENRETASEETRSPGLDRGLKFPEDLRALSCSLVNLLTELENTKVAMGPGFEMMSAYPSILILNSYKSSIHNILH